MGQVDIPKHGQEKSEKLPNQRKTFIEEFDLETNPNKKLEMILPKDIFDKYEKDESAFGRAISIIQQHDEIKDEDKKLLIGLVVENAKALLLSDKLDDDLKISLFEYYKNDKKLSEKIWNKITEKRPVVSLQFHPVFSGEQYDDKVIKQAVKTALNDLESNAASLFMYSHLFADKQYAENALMAAVKVVPRTAFVYMEGFIEQPYAEDILVEAARMEQNAAFEYYVEHKNMRVIEQAAVVDPQLFFDNFEKYEGRRDDIKTILFKLASIQPRSMLKKENFNYYKNSVYVTELLQLIRREYPKIFSEYSSDYRDFLIE